MSQLLQFEKLRNTRDLGGMKTADGFTIKPGLLFRSGHLFEISDSDRNQLSGVLSTIIDFRTDRERKEKPDQNIPGTDNVHIPIVDSLTPGISREKKADKAVIRKLMGEPEKAKNICAVLISCSHRITLSVSTAAFSGLYRIHPAAFCGIVQRGKIVPESPPFF